MDAKLNSNTNFYLKKKRSKLYINIRFSRYGFIKPQLNITVITHYTSQ